MKVTQLSDPQLLVAPCGINCRLCRAYVRIGQSLPCPGCRGEDTSKPRSCVHCRMKNCEKLVQNGSSFCYECDEFPCFLVKRLDKRYRLKYSTSVIDNLRYIQQHGLEAFAVMDEQRWTCPQCSALMSMHLPGCQACGYQRA